MESRKTSVRTDEIEAFDEVSNYYYNILSTVLLTKRGFKSLSNVHNIDNLRSVASSYNVVRFNIKNEMTFYSISKIFIDTLILKRVIKILFNLYLKLLYLTLKLKYK